LNYALDVISAGEFSVDTNNDKVHVYVTGRSITLKVDSRKEDAIIIHRLITGEQPQKNIYK
jgi:hypothetical protein